MNMARVNWAVRVLGGAVAVAVLQTSPALSQPALKDSAGSGPYKVGMAFRSYAPKEPYDWRGAREHTLNVVVWYPAGAIAREKPLVIRLRGAGEIIAPFTRRREAAVLKSA
jgi:hypothetical protein